MKVDISSIIKIPKHDDVLEVIQDNQTLEGMHLGLFAAKEFLNLGMIDVTRFVLFAILHHLKIVLGCVNVGIQGFGGSCIVKMNCFEP